MTGERIVLVHPDRASLVQAVADRFFRTVSGILERRTLEHRTLEHSGAANIVLTGGTVGIDILAAIGTSPERDTLDWSGIHLWWGDERWLPTGDPERNDTQADAVFLSLLPMDAGQIHRFPASDRGLDLDAAAVAYTAELAAHATDGAALPHFDLVFLGVGPDGHVASLFPDREGIRIIDAPVIPVRNSPKPPPERLSLTLPAINSADRVWLALAGADKASALGLALAGANTIEVPAAGAEGRLRTVFFVDQAAAAEIPAELIVSEY